MKHLIIICLFLTFFPLKTLGQYSHENTWGISTDIGMAIPFTDIKRHTFFPSVDPPVTEYSLVSSINGMYFLHPKLLIEGGYHFNNLIGYSPKINLDYNTTAHITTLSIAYWTTPIQIFVSSPLYFEKRNPLRIHDFRFMPKIGISLLFTKTDLKKTDEEKPIQANHNFLNLGESNSQTIGIPVGVKISFQASRLNPKFSVFDENIHFFIDFTFTYVFSNDIDGYSNPNTGNDMLTRYSLGLMYIFKE